METNRRHPNADWPWWKITGVALFSFGVFGIIMISIPPLSLPVILLGTTLPLLATITAVWDWKEHNWFSQFCLVSLFSFQLLAIGIHAWLYVLPIIWVYPLVGAYLLAWVLPALNPIFSKFLWQEQTAPQTRLGRIVLGLVVSLAPVSGALGASIGMFKSRFDGPTGVYLVIGPLFLVLSTAFSFTFAYQLWPHRPWANHNKGLL
jgi:hypothetical protein